MGRGCVIKWTEVVFKKKSPGWIQRVENNRSSTLFGQLDCRFVYWITQRVRSLKERQFGCSLDVNTSLKIKLTSYERRVCTDKSRAHPSVWTPPSTPHRSERERGSPCLLFQPLSLCFHFFLVNWKQITQAVLQVLANIYAEYSPNSNFIVWNYPKNVKDWFYLGVISLLSTISRQYLDNLTALDKSSCRI